MMDFLSNPAYFILTAELLLFMIIVNVVLVVFMKKRNGKTAAALKALVTDIKIKGEEHQKKIDELLVSPELINPEAIKEGIEQLLADQTELYKDVIKAVRTQKESDVVALGDSVSGLVNSAMKLGRESGEGSVDKEAQAKLEESNEALSKDKNNLQLVNGDLKSKLEKTAREMEVLMTEYKNMMDNVNGKDEQGNSSEDSTSSSEEVASPETTADDQPESSGLEMSDDILDISGSSGSLMSEEETDDLWGEAFEEQAAAESDGEVEDVSADSNEDLIDIAAELSSEDSENNNTDSISKETEGNSSEEPVENETTEDQIGTPADMADDILNEIEASDEAVDKDENEEAA